MQVFAHLNLLGYTPSLATELKILSSVKALSARSGECKQTDDSSWHPETKKFISDHRITCKTLPENDNKMRCISLINILTGKQMNQLGSLRFSRISMICQ